MSFISISNNAVRPEELHINDVVWIGQQGDISWIVHGLLNDPYYGKVIDSTTPPLSVWETGNPLVWSFSMVSPLDFWKNPVIIVPPRWINLNSHAAGKWHVKSIQYILELTIQKNTSTTVNPCLGALMHFDKIREGLWRAIEWAGYEQVWEKWNCGVFVHRTTMHSKEAIKSLLAM